MAFGGRFAIAVKAADLALGEPIGLRPLKLNEAFRTKDILCMSNNMCYVIRINVGYSKLGRGALS